VIATRQASDFDLASADAKSEASIRLSDPRAWLGRSGRRSRAWRA